MPRRVPALPGLEEARRGREEMAARTAAADQRKRIQATDEEDQEQGTGLGEDQQVREWR